MRAVPSTAALERFRALLAARFGLRFEPSQQQWLAEVFDRRRGAGSEAEYLAALELRPTQAETDALVAELTVGETFFFRNSEKFDALRLTVLPALMRARESRGERRLSLLSAGCASGEEAYTLAICLQGLAHQAERWDWQVHAFDLNPAVLAKAVAGRYGSWSLRATPEAVQRHWFHARDGQFEVDPVLRRHVRFEQRNVCTEDAAFWRPGAFDVVFCRNMLMYLQPQAQRAALARIAGALAPDGYLFMGDAESLRDLSTQFELRHSEGCFYYQRAVRPIRPPQPAPAPAQGLPEVVAIVVLPERERLFVLLGEERHVEALALAERLLEPAPADTELLTVRAVLLSQQGRVDEALQICEQVLALDDDRQVAAAGHHVAALCRESSGDVAGAERRYRLAAALDPGFAMPVLRLGLLARRRGDAASQRRELNRAAELLQREDERRLLLFGGGFGREALTSLCEAQLPRAAA